MHSAARGFRHRIHMHLQVQEQSDESPRNLKTEGQNTVGSTGLCPKMRLHCLMSLMRCYSVVGRFGRSLRQSTGSWLTNVSVMNGQCTGGGSL